MGWVGGWSPVVIMPGVGGLEDGVGVGGEDCHNAEMQNIWWFRKGVGGWSLVVIMPERRNIWCFCGVVVLGGVSHWHGQP